MKISFENVPQKSVVTITKVDQDTNQPLAGAILLMKNSKGEIIYKFESTTTSTTITDLAYDTYTIEEVNAPDGYKKSDQIITITIDKNHLSHQVTFKNAKEVPVPDTAETSSMIMIFIGLIMTWLGIRYITSNGKKRYN